MQIACADMGVQNCDYAAYGDTETEVEGKLLHHGVHAHPEKMQGMSEQDYVGMMNTMHEKLAA